MNRVGKAHREPDQTLEVLMMDLDPEKMKWFWKDVCPTAAEATKVGEPHYISYILSMCCLVVQKI